MTEQAGRKAINIRLSTEALRMLDRLMERSGLTRTATIELAIRFYARTELAEQPGTAKTSG